MTLIQQPIKPLYLSVKEPETKLVLDNINGVLIDILEQNRQRLEASGLDAALYLDNWNISNPVTILSGNYRVASAVIVNDTLTVNGQLTSVC